MQIAWEKQGKSQHMNPHGKILRMLLLGGGGCGGLHLPGAGEKLHINYPSHHVKKVVGVPATPGNIGDMLRSANFDGGLVGRIEVEDTLVCARPPLLSCPRSPYPRPMHVHVHVPPLSLPTTLALWNN